MGRRSRKRTSAPAAGERPETQPPPRGVARTRSETPPAAPRAPRLSARREDAPKAPWHPIPLVEMTILAGLVLVIAGFFSNGDDRPVLIFGGLALVSLAALELAIREHFAGFRSHSALLAAVTGLLAAVPLWFTTLPQEALIVVFVLVVAVAFRLLRGAFARRSGGLSWRA